MTTRTVEQLARNQLSCVTCQHQRRFHHHANASARTEGKQRCTICEKNKSIGLPSTVHRVQWLPTVEKEGGSQ